MTKIDDFAGFTSASITSLKVNSITNVAASYISANYYEATVASIQSYATNMMINLKLNQDITGATTININSYGNKLLKKVNVSGTLDDLVTGDITANKYYLFIYNGTYFVSVTGGISGSSTSSTSGSYFPIIGAKSGSYAGIRLDSTYYETGDFVISLAAPALNGNRKATFQDTDGTVQFMADRERIFQLPLNTSASLVGGEKAYMRIPTAMNTWSLTNAGGMCATASSSGSPTFTVTRNGTDNMMSTNVVIDTGEYDSATADIAPTTGSNVYVEAGYQIKVECTVPGVDVTYAVVSLVFKSS
jgi:hypothetical protein